MDRLAGEGRLFTRAFSVAGVCAPSRSAIITGVYPTYIGAHHMRTVHRNPLTPNLIAPYEVCPPPYVKLIPEYFRAAGYYTTNNVKTDYQFAPPVTAWDRCHKTAHWRDRPDARQPFFAVFNLEGTHESQMWDAHWTDRELLTDPAAVRVPPYLPDTPRVRESIARQYDNIARNDAIAGELLAQLEEDGLADNTIVVNWSDHGEGLPRGKRWPYDHGIRIPLIVRWPGRVAPGGIDDRLVSLIDLGPTMLSLAGLDLPAYLQGQSFAENAPRRTHVYASRDRHDEAYDMTRAVRDERYKYIRHYYPGTSYQTWNPYGARHPATQELQRGVVEGALEGAARQFAEAPRPAEELYDTVADPQEITNLAADPAHAEVLDRLRAELDGWMERYDRYHNIVETEMVRQWWPGGIQPETEPPLALPVGSPTYTLDALTDGQVLKAPLVLQLQSGTQGASIQWCLDGEEPPRWRLYTGFLRFEKPGKLRLKVQAHRIGYRPAERQFDIELV
jgi:arylsulfatase A-like enzyme